MHPNSIDAFKNRLNKHLKRLAIKPANLPEKMVNIVPINTHHYKLNTSLMTYSDVEYGEFPHWQYIHESKSDTWILEKKYSGP